MKKEKILPLIKLKYFSKDNPGHERKEADIVCSVCNRSGVSVGSSLRDPSGNHQVICEDCTVDAFQKEHEFKSRDVAASHRRRIFDVGYLLQEMIIDKYLDKKGIESVDDLNKNEFVALLNLGKEIYNSHFSKGAKHEIEHIENQKEIIIKLSPPLEDLFADEKSLNRIAISFPQNLSINFSREQYSNLLNMAHLGNWMINAQRSGAKGDEQYEEYNDLESYLFSFAKKMGFGNLVDEYKGKFYTSWDFMELSDADSFHEEYDEENFWGELVSRLADRDMEKCFGEKIEKTDKSEYFSKLFNCEEKYEKEVEDFGMQRMEINENIKVVNYSEENADISKEKVGRNDQCSCGSGKKYKKCCGI